MSSTPDRLWSADCQVYTYGKGEEEEEEEEGEENYFLLA